MAASIILGAAHADILRSGVQARDFAAELLVLKGNFERLRTPKYPPKEQQGLHQKIKADLNVLPLLARHYLQGEAAAETRVVGQIQTLRSAFTARRWHVFSRVLEKLTIAFPLYLHDINGTAATPDQIRWAGRLYAERCAACHRYHNPQSEFPTPDLFTWAHKMNPREFAARMITGIHGTPMISLQNPLDEAQIAALIAYFRHETRHENPHR
ncbi:hypothetical protein BI364_06445 [Acidihalobacter yilgarnensis]|uniref:Cytochrome c domain-containing protein n=1 Tax=Acidihalobacter yilgarnensis TaxID=2819280 RepID=A0A1D8IME1_9GAMM|nr:cytochrome c [Acidihalobacter yilgarnensis]AOU97643.1 hypothetical protein BI364_06445 [Acidihalobacter yilgarnensis]